MKIKHLQVSNFLGVREASLPLTKKINIFVGENAAGKSSLAASLEYLVSGQARGLKYLNEGEALIYDEAKKAEIVATLEDLTLRRTRTAKAGLLRVIQDGKETDQIPAELDRPFALNPYLYFSLSEKDRKAMLYSIRFPEGVTVDEIKERLPGIPDNFSSYVATATIRGFQAAYNEIVELRRDSKRQLADLKPPDLQAAKNWKGYNLADISLEDAQAQLSRLEAERDNLLVEKGRIANAVPREKIQNELDILTDEIRATKKIADTNSEALETEKSGLIRALKTTQKTLDEKTIAATSHQSDLHTKMPDFKLETCPIFDTQCPLTMKQRQPLWRSFDSRKKSAENELAAINKDIPPLQEYISTTNIRIREIDLKIQAAITAKTDLQHLRKLEASLKEQLKRSTNAVDPRGINDRIEKADIRLQNGRALINAIKDYREAVEFSQSLKDKAEQAHRIIDYADQLARRFAPNGIPAELTLEVLGAFESRINANAAIFGARLEIAPDFLPELNGRHYHLLSSSEQWRARAIFQEALAFISGSPWLVMDGVDILDRSNRQALIAMLKEVAKSYSNIFVMATLGDVRPEPSEDPDIDLWTIYLGSVSKLEAGQEAA